MCVRERERAFCGCVSYPSECVCVFLRVGSGSMCVWVRGEVSLGWPWLESWRRAEVKEEICRKDTHHFPHYYFCFFLLLLLRLCVSLLLILLLLHLSLAFPSSSYSPPLNPPSHFLSLLLSYLSYLKLYLCHQSSTC